MREERSALAVVLEEMRRSMSEGNARHARLCEFFCRADFEVTV